MVKKKIYKATPICIFWIYSISVFTQILSSLSGLLVKLDIEGFLLSDNDFLVEMEVQTGDHLVLAVLEDSELDILVDDVDSFSLARLVLEPVLVALEDTGRLFGRQGRSAYQFSENGPLSLDLFELLLLDLVLVLPMRQRSLVLLLQFIDVVDVLLDLLSLLVLKYQLLHVGPINSSEFWEGQSSDSHLVVHRLQRGSGSLS